MRIFIFLPLLFHIVHPLYTGYEFNFNYTSFVSTAIPQVAKRVLSSTGFKCQVQVQVQENATLYVKIYDHMVGDNNDHLDEPCQNSNHPTIDRWTEQFSGHEHFEEPFIVYLKNRVNVMEVPSTEPLWVSNIKKGILQNFAIQPIVANFDKPQQPTWTKSENDVWRKDVNDDGSPEEKFRQLFTTNDYPTYFEVTENNILGRCKSENTMLPDSTAEVTDEKDGRWKLLKVVNFDKCSEAVMLQSSSTFDTIPSSLITSRTSTGEWTLGGRPGNFTLLNVTRTGLVTATPFAMKESLQSTTKQIMELTSVSKIEVPLNIQDATKFIPAWLYEVHSPFPNYSGKKEDRPTTEQGSNPWLDTPFWIRYLGKPRNTPFLLETVVTGTEIVEENKIQDDMRVRVLLLLRQVADTLLSDPTLPSATFDWEVLDDHVTKIVQVSDYLKVMTKDKIILVYDHLNLLPYYEYAGIQMQLFLDACAASGSYNCYDHLLGLIDEGGRITDTRAISIFATLTSHTNTPLLVDRLISTALKLTTKENPFLTSVALVSVAKVYTKVCIDRQREFLTFYGRFECSGNSMFKVIGEMMRRLNLSRKKWNNSLWAETLAGLGSTQVMPPLFFLIEDPRSQDPDTIITAIRGLSSEYYVKHKRNLYDTIVPKLNKVLFSQQYTTKVRTSALDALMRWKVLDSSWWHLVAKLTWDPKDDVFASYVYFTLENISKDTTETKKDQSFLASCSLLIAKRFCLRKEYPTSYSWNQDFEEHKLGTSAQFSYLPGLLKEFKLFLDAHYEGTTMEFFKVHWDQSIVTFIQQILRGETKGDKPSPKHRWFTTTVVNFFENEIFLPLNRFLLRRETGFNGRDALIEFSVDGFRLHLYKFFLAHQTEVFLPTEVGLPLFIRSKSPMLMSSEGYTKLTSPHMEKPTWAQFYKELNIDIQYKNNAKFFSKTVSSMSVYSPWNQLSYTAGIDSMKNIQTPLQGTVHRQNKPIAELFAREYKFTNKAINEVKIPLLYAHNVPYVSIDPLWPQKQYLPWIRRVLPITVDKQTFPLVKDTTDLPTQRTGLVGGFHWKGDLANPISLDNSWTFVRNPLKLFELVVSPTARLWQAYLEVDMANSPNKQIDVEISVDSVQAWEPWVPHESPSAFQPPQNSAQKSDPEENRIRYGSPTDAHETQSSTDLTNRKEFMAQRIRPLHPYGNFYVLDVLINSMGTDRHAFKFESWLFHEAYRKDVRDTTSGSFAVEYGTFPLSGETNVDMFCFNLVTSSPNIMFINQLERYLTRPDVKLHREVTISHSFHTQHSMPRCPYRWKHLKSNTMKGHMHMGLDRSKRILKSIKNSCDVDRYNPVCGDQIPLVYDRFNMTLNYTEANGAAAGVQVLEYIAPYLIGNDQLKRFTTSYKPNHQRSTGGIGRLTGHRLLSENRWNVEFDTPSAYSQSNSYQMPDFIENVKLNLDFFIKTGTNITTNETNPNETDPKDMKFNNHMSNNLNSKYHGRETEKRTSLDEDSNDYTTSYDSGSWKNHLEESEDDSSSERAHDSSENLSPSGRDEENSIVLEGNELEQWKYSLIGEGIESETDNNPVGQDDPRKICTVTREEIITYNNITIPNKFGGCFATLSNNKKRMPDNVRDPKWKVFVRRFKQTDEDDDNSKEDDMDFWDEVFELRIVDLMDGVGRFKWTKDTMIDISTVGGIKVNMKPVKIEDGQPMLVVNSKMGKKICEIRKIFLNANDVNSYNFYYRVDLHDLVNIHVRRSYISLELPYHYKNHVGGACGRSWWWYDGEMVGPKRCIYNTVQGFMDAWTAEWMEQPRDTCPHEKLEKIKEEVGDYRKNCSKWDITDDHMVDDREYFEFEDQAWGPKTEEVEMIDYNNAQDAEDAKENVNVSGGGEDIVCTYLEDVCVGGATEDQCVQQCKDIQKERMKQVLSELSETERFLVFGKDQNPDFKIVYPEWDSGIESGKEVRSLRINAKNANIQNITMESFTGNSKYLVDVTGDDVMSGDVTYDSNKPRIAFNCNWRFVNKTTVVTVNDCVKNGLHVMIISDELHINLHPVGDQKRTSNSKYLGPHILYVADRSTINQYLDDQLRINVESASNAGNFETPDELDKFRVPEKSAFLSPSATNERPVPPGTASAMRPQHKTIELAVFCDSHLYDKFGRTLKKTPDTPIGIVDYIFMLVNALEGLYSQQELGGNSLHVKLVRIEITAKRGPRTFGGRIGDYLSEFCEWQKNKNPRGDTNGNHWDNALMLSGLDLRDARGNPNVIGLAWMNGMCDPRFSCSICEGGSFLSLYIMAHELGHNLGMDHDGSRTSSSCNPNRNIMSPSVGAGKTTWSACSASTIQRVVSQSSCLDDGNTSGDNLKPKEKDLPGHKMSLDAQCQLAYGNRYSYAKTGTNVCSYLFCSDGRIKRGAHPALAGSTCGGAPGSRDERICLDGACRPISDLNRRSG